MNDSLKELAKAIMNITRKVAEDSFLLGLHSSEPLTKSEEEETKKLFSEQYLEDVLNDRFTIEEFTKEMKSLDF